MRKIFIAFLLFFVFVNISLLFSQENNSEIIQIDSNIENFDIDFFGNFYFVNKNTLKKYNNNFENLSNYDSKKYGDISQIDASNPFVTLLYYNSSNTIVFLDNTLSEILSPINLDDAGFLNSNIIANSQKGFWLFDYQMSSVFLLDRNLKTLQQSPNLFAVLENKLLISMKETNNYLLLELEDNNILIFDKFANYIKKYSNIFETKINYVIFNDNIFFIINDNLFVYDITNDKETSYKLNEISNFDKYQIFNNKIYFLNDGKLYQKKINF